MAADLVSVVIPCRNEQRFIEACLSSVLSWDTAGRELEVLVVDGRSDDRTPALVAELARRDSRVRLVDNPQRTKPVALNVGIQAARGEWIVRLDAHSSYPSDYLVRCLETAERTGADNVGGVVVARLAEDTLQARLVQALTTHPFGVGGAGFRIATQEGPADTVPFGCFHRSLFGRVGLFDERLTHSQDFEFNQRILRSGGKIWLNPSIRVAYFNQSRLGAFLRKVFVRDGPWLPWMWYVAPYSFRIRHAVPMAFTAALLGSATLALLGSSMGLWLLAGIAIPYGLLAVASAVQQAVRFKEAAFVPLLPPLFLAYHLSHGGGALVASIRLLLGNAPVQARGMTTPDSESSGRKL